MEDLQCDRSPMKQPVCDLLAQLTYTRVLELHN